MQLQFEYIQQVSLGQNPSAVHFPDNMAQVFHTDDNGRMYGIDTSTPEGAWENREFSSPLVVAPDLDIQYFTLRRAKYGIYGSWHSDNRHRFAIYGMDYDVSDYIEDGSIEFSGDNPIATMSLTLANPSQVFMNEEQSMLTPGAKVQFSFRAGDSSPYHMGTFFVDRGGYTVNDESISIDGRNTIGKVLKDQTFDESNVYPANSLKATLESILTTAGISPTKYYVSDSSATVGMQFPSNMNILDGINEVLKCIRGWRMQELLDGSIAIGPDNYEKFDQPARYTFYRNRDIWSRKITRDDMNTYRRVCVHTDDWSVNVYKDVSIWEGWSLGVQKTYYIQVANGTTLEDAKGYADELAERLSGVGVIEDFAGPFRPHIQPGDEAEIINPDGRSILLGLITSVKHSFGKQGFATEFVVDSGGRIGRGRISDFIEKINNRQSVSSVTRLY